MNARRFTNDSRHEKKGLRRMIDDLHRPEQQPIRSESQGDNMVLSYSQSFMFLTPLHREQNSCDVTMNALSSDHTSDIALPVLRPVKRDILTRLQCYYRASYLIHTIAAFKCEFDWFQGLGP